MREHSRPWKKSILQTKTGVSERMQVFTEKSDFEGGGKKGIDLVEISDLGYKNLKMYIFTCRISIFLNMLERVTGALPK